MGASQRRKGASFEREVAEAFRAAGVPARRGIGQARGGGAEVPDVEADHLHLECKVGRAPDPWGALAQATRDMRPGVWPVAVTKRDRHGAIVSMRLQDWLQLWTALLGEAGERMPALVAVATQDVMPAKDEE